MTWLVCIHSLALSTVKRYSLDIDRDKPHKGAQSTRLHRPYLNKGSQLP